jgi:putative FmdB family regulatory protein
MPLYEYECDNGHRFEVIQKYSDPLVETCTQCGAPVHKLMSSPAIQFKGTGWYITDYARKGGDTSSGDKGGEKKDSKESKDSKDAASTKSETSSSSSSDTSSTKSAGASKPAATTSKKD